MVNLKAPWLRKEMTMDKKPVVNEELSEAERERKEFGEELLRDLMKMHDRNVKELKRLDQARLDVYMGGPYTTDEYDIVYAHLCEIDKCHSTLNKCGCDIINEMKKIARRCGIKFDQFCREYEQEKKERRKPKKKADAAKEDGDR